MASPLNKLSTGQLDAVDGILAVIRRHDLDLETEEPLPEGIADLIRDLAVMGGTSVEELIQVLGRTIKELEASIREMEKGNHG